MHRAQVSGGIAFLAALMLGPSAVRSKSPEKGPPLKAGVPAPVFRLRAPDGGVVRLDELAYPGKEKSYAKKRPLFLDFFRTDCEPCKNALPDLVKLTNTVQPQGIDVILVALLEQDDGRQKLDRFLAEAKLPMKVVIDDNELFAKKYLGDPVTLPATFLIDQNGVVLKAKYGASGSYEAHFGESMRDIAMRRKAEGK